MMQDFFFLHFFLGNMRFFPFYWAHAFPPKWREVPLMVPEVFSKLKVLKAENASFWPNTSNLA